MLVILPRAEIPLVVAISEVLRKLFISRIRCSKFTQTSPINSYYEVYVLGLMSLMITSGLVMRSLPHRQQTCILFMPKPDVSTAIQLRMEHLAIIASKPELIQLISNYGNPRDPYPVSQSHDGCPSLS